MDPIEEILAGLLDFYLQEEQDRLRIQERRVRIIKQIRKNLPQILRELGKPVEVPIWKNDPPPRPRLVKNRKAK